MKNLLNFRELSRILTGKCGNIRFDVRIPEKYWDKIDNIIFKELPKWWRQYKKQNSKK